MRILNKIVKKDETLSTDKVFPHTHNEIESIAAVKSLSVEACRTLFKIIRTLPSDEAALWVKNYLKKDKTAGL